eukprot:Skav235640  [mRNA]  locus=scaffold358:523884:525677:- [translate_table: standard]
MNNTSTMVNIDLEREQIGDIGALAKGLRTNRTVKELNLGGNGLTASSLEVGKGCATLWPKIRRQVVSPLRSQGLTRFLNCSNLESLVVDHEVAEVAKAPSPVAVAPRESYPFVLEKCQGISTRFFVIDFDEEQANRCWALRGDSRSDLAVQVKRPAYSRKVEIKKFSMQSMTQILTEISHFFKTHFLKGSNLCGSTALMMVDCDRLPRCLGPDTPGDPGICAATMRGDLAAVRGWLRRDPPQPWNAPPTAMARRLSRRRSPQQSRTAMHRGHTALHLAAREGHAQILQVLLAAKALVEARDNSSRGPRRSLMPSLMVGD